MRLTAPSWRVLRAFEPLPGKDLSRYSAWAWVLPKSWVPRWAAGFSKRVQSRLFFMQSVVNWKSRGKERLELMVAGEKLFEGNAFLMKPEHCPKFPEVNTTAGVWSPAGELVILEYDCEHSPVYKDAVAAWADSWPGRTTRLLVADSHLVWPRAWQASPEEHVRRAVTLDARPLYDQVAYTNTSVPYVFLVDKQGRIRWRSCWAPTQREVEFLRTGWSLE